MARSTLPATAMEVPTAVVTGGVDTHLDVHVVAALDQIGGLLGTASFATTPVGYRKLLQWLQAFGTISVVGVEGTSSYGAGLTRTLQAAGVSVVEVDRPNRQVCRRQGKSHADLAGASSRLRHLDATEPCGRGTSEASGGQLTGPRAAKPV